MPTVADSLRRVGEANHDDGTIHIESTALDRDRVLFFRQKSANQPHEIYDWILEVQSDGHNPPNLVLMNARRDANGHNPQWTGVCKFNWDGTVILGPFPVP